MNRVIGVLAVVALAGYVIVPALVATPVPPNALDILWADYCARGGPECLPTSSPSLSPSLSPSPTPVPTATPSPLLTPTATTPPATPTPTTTPAPTANTDDYALLSRADLLALPMSGAAWTALKSAADASPGTPDITCNQDSRLHPGTALAAGIVYARTGTESYRTKAIALVEAARGTTRDCGNAVLSLGRQLGAYVLAADFAGYRDAGFVAWVSSVRTRDFPASHGRWHVLAGTAANTSSNWGTFALASLTAADAYLRDPAGLARDRSLFTDYGDGSSSFVHTSSYQAVWSCPTGYEINPASCTDPRKEGAAVEDASRTSFPTIDNYPTEAAQGYVLTAELLDAWAVNDRQVCRNALWRERGSNLNRSSADQYVTWLTNERCGLAQPTKPAVFGRIFGFADWLWP